jgi:hypothetical protein
MLFDFKHYPPIRATTQRNDQSHQGSISNRPLNGTITGAFEDSNTIYVVMLDTEIPMLPLSLSPGFRILILPYSARNIRL